MNDQITRRDVLRRGVAATGAATIGVAGLSGTAAATFDCPKTVGYWKNHPENWTLEEIRIQKGSASEQKYPNEAMLDVLNEPACGDKALIMAKQVIAAQLSIAGLGGREAGVCDVESVKDTMEDGIIWLDCSDGACVDGWDYLADPENYEPSRSWEDSRGEDGEAIKDRLDAFNNGAFCENCDGDDGTDGRENEGSGNGDEGRGRRNGGRGTGGRSNSGRGNGPPGHAGDGPGRGP